MRIAVITPVTLHILNLAVGLAKKGNTLGLFAPSNQKSTVLPDARIQFFPLPSLPDIFHPGQQLITSFPTEIPLLLSKFNPEVVHFVDPNYATYYPMLFWCKLHRIPLVCSQIKENFSAMSAYLCSLSSLFIGSSESQITNLKKYPFNYHLKLTKAMDLKSVDQAYLEILKKH